MLSLVVPTYNERENLPSLVERVHKSLSDSEYELIVVDDNSPDGTAEIARRLSLTYPIRVLCRQVERGLASAVVAGFKIAKGDILGVIDADLQHPPEKIPELLKEIDNGSDIVIASRYVSQGGTEGWSKKRTAISRGVTALTRLLLPSIRKVKDPLSGFFLVKREVIEGIELRPIGYKILLEILAKGKADEVKEVPYIFKERVYGESKLDLGEQKDYLAHLLSLAAREREALRFLKFCLVGLSGVGVNFGIFHLFFGILGFYYLLAYAISWEGSVLSNFALNDIWTFRDRRISSLKATLIRGLKFNLISLGVLAIYQGGGKLLVDFLGVNEYLALGIVIVIGVIFNFGLNVFWTWRKGEVQKASPAPQ